MIITLGFNCRIALTTKKNNTKHEPCVNSVFHRIARLSIK